MGNFFSDMFSSGGSQSSSSSTGYTKQQKEYQSDLFSLYGTDIKQWADIQDQINKLNKQGKPIPAELQAQQDALAAKIKPNVYQGERVAPLTDLQQTAITGAGNYSSLFSTPTTNSNPMMAETGTALQTLLSGGGGATNFKGATDFAGAKQFTPEDTANYFKGVIYDPTMKSLTQDVNPATQEAFAGPGFYGAARSQALQKNATDTADTLNAARSSLEWDVTKQNQALAEAEAARRISSQEAEANRRVSSQDTAAGRMQTAVSQGMEYSKLPAQQTAQNLANAASQVQGLSQILGIGAVEQTQEQNQLNADITKFAEENQITDPETLQVLLTLLGMSYSKSSSSSETTPAGGLSGAGAGAVAEVASSLI
jgi:hypothetical protein